MSHTKDQSDADRAVSASSPKSLKEKGLAGHGDLEGQRRQTTVLFTDMAGYTPLAERLGEEATYVLIQRVIKEMSEAVHAHEGTVQEVTGDGLMALFGAPAALEDAPVLACRAALEIQDRMTKLDDEIEVEHGVRPAFRVGVHSGPVVVGKVGDAQQAAVTVLGDTVNLAARLESVAEPGGILISEATHKLVEGYVHADFAGEREVKGKTEAQRVYRLEGMKTGVTRFDVSVGRGLTKLIGRRRELETLLGIWDEARAGRLRVANVSGEAGIGKSRLVYEFRRRLDDDSVFLLEGHCTAESRATPFLPFIDVMRRSFRIGDRADTAEAEHKLGRGLEVLGLEPADHIPYLLNLLGHEAPRVSLDGVASEGSSASVPATQSWRCSGSAAGCR